MGKFWRLLPFWTVTLISLWHGGASAKTIVVFADLYHQGTRALLNISKCDNVPLNLRGQITAVNTQGGCTRLYDKLGCTGSYTEVMARSPAHYNLEERDFNDKTLSAGPCPEPCSVNVTGPAPPKEGLNIRIFDRSQFQGATEVLNVNRGCTVIPRKFNYRVLTVNTSAHDDTCFQLYNNVDCQYNMTLGHDTIELRPRTPFHDNIARWHIAQMKAISLCSFKCQKTPAPPPAPVMPKDENEVVIYDEIDFKGNSLRLHISDTKSLRLDQYNGWEGAAQSISVYANGTKNSSCVDLFSTENCAQENPSVRLTASLTNLALHNFSAVTRSLRQCTPGNKSGTQAKRQKAKSSVSRWITGLAVVGGLIGCAALLLITVGKWWYPQMPVVSISQIFQRGQQGPTNWGQMRF